MRTCRRYHRFHLVISEPDMYMLKKRFLKYSIIEKYMYIFHEGYLLNEDCEFRTPGDIVEDHYHVYITTTESISEKKLKRLLGVPTYYFSYVSDSLSEENIKEYFLNSNGSKRLESSKLKIIKR